MGNEKFLGKAVDIFTGFSCERFLGISADSQERFMGISADFPQNCYLGCVWFCSLVRQIMLFNVTLVKNEHIFWIDKNQILVSCKHIVIVTLNNITQPNFCEPL